MALKLYDESQQPDFCTALYNEVYEDGDFHFVGLGLPSGAFKVRYSGFFTHAIFYLNGQEWVVKINSITSAGGNLVTASYAVDYLKDYWLKYQSLVSNYIVGRTTVDSYVDQMLTDTERSFAASGIKQTVTGNAIVDSNGWYYVVVINTPITTVSAIKGPSVFIMDVAAWFGLQQQIVSDSDLQNAVIRVCKVPAVITSNVQTLTRQTFSIYAGTTTRDIDVGSTFYEVKSDGATTDGRVVYNNLGISTPITSWLDTRCTCYTLRIPLVGNVPLQIQGIGELQTVEMFYNLTDCTVSATVNGSESTRTGSVPLPSVSWVTSTQPTAVRNITTNAAVGAVTAVTGAVVTAASGGTAAPLGLPLIASGVTIGAQSLAGLSMAEYGANTSSTANGWDGVYDPLFRLTTIRAVPMLSNYTHQLKYGLPSGAVGVTLNQLPPGDYWLDFSSATVYGAYPDQYRAALHGKRIRV